jgi:alkyl sulfatase BDS1-like metallo-beta-lactamase superfamily hydrolase
MGWFDGNPAHLWPHPPEQAARRYVEFMGGADAVLEKAQAAFDEGDYRWVAEVTAHVVFADPENRAARELEAAALEQLGYGAENSTWRNFFLMGAKELRDGISGEGTVAAPPDMVVNLTSAQLFEAMAVRIDGPRAAERRLVINWHFTDIDERFLLRLENGVLTHLAGAEADDADAGIAIERSGIDEVIAGKATFPDLGESGRLTVSGDATALMALFELSDAPTDLFPIVTP